MKRIRRIAAILLGLVFLASGLLKMMDPVGTGLIVSAYFKFFHLAFLDPAARWVGVVLSLLETCVGASLVNGTFRKLTGILTWILTAFFTGVTLILVIANPEMDCGCFGEAVHLTHVQSFVKNLILLALCAVAFVPLNDLGTPSKRRQIAFWGILAGLLFSAGYNQFHLPTVDFTDFAPGNRLFAAVEEDVPEEDDFLGVHVYVRDGQEGYFAANRVPDSTWTFVRTDTVSRNGLKFEEKTPVLSLRDDMGDYQDNLAALGKVLILSLYRPESLRDPAWEKLVALKDAAEREGLTPLVLISGGPENLRLLPSLLQPYAYFSDDKTLITLNRSNGGATYLDDGLIVRKWHRFFLPDEKALAKVAEADPVDATVSTITRGRLRSQGFLLYLFAVLVFL